MSNDIQIFNFEENNKIRVLEKDGNIWFVAKDICDILGMKTEQTRRLDKDEKGLYKTQTLGGNQNMTVVNESGLWALVIRSNKPEAKKFRKWVTSEVLPAIRKHGMYLSEKMQETFKNDPEAFNTLAKRYVEEQEKVKALEAKIQKDLPYAVLGRVVSAEPGSISYADAALFLAQHGIPIGRNRLLKYGREKKYLNSQKNQWNKPTQKGIENGIVNLEIDGANGYKFTTRTMVTPKGLQKLSLAFYREHYPLGALMEDAEDNELLAIEG